MAKKHNELKDLRQFGIVLAAMLIIFGLIYFFNGRGAWYPWFFGLGLIVFCMTIIMPKSLRKTYSVFTKVAYAIGWFNTRIILVLIYYCILSPIAFLMKIFGKDLLKRNIDKSVSSYWVTRQQVKSIKEQLEKQF